MPVQAQRRHTPRLSAYFYAYGKKCGSRGVTNLLLSLIFIFIFSYPIVFRSLHSIGSNTDEIDGHFWQHSPYLKPENASSYDITSSLIIQQIRIANENRIVNPELLLQTRAIQEALATRSVLVDGTPVSLANICLLRHHQCVVHSPLEYWQKREGVVLSWLSVANAPTRDWTMHINTRRISDSSGLSMHPRSVFGNVTLDDDGQFVSADSVILTLFLQETPFLSTTRVWDALWQNITAELHIHPLSQEQQQQQQGQVASSATRSWQTKADIHANVLHYKFKAFSFQHRIEVYLYLVGYLIVCFLVSTLFGNHHLVRSQFAQGFATVFAMLACYTTTRGILEYLDIHLNLLPWYLLMVVPFVSSLENMLLLTNAVLNAGCDMQVKEKTGRGIESVGVPMTLALIAEWVILAIGSSMGIPQISEFCLFARTALLVGYLIDMTFGLSFLAINVKCAELTDLDDRQTSKRLRELAKCDIDTDVAPEFCPIQEPLDDSIPKTCAECKHFKTHRTYNALMLCLVILALTLIRPTTPTRMMANDISRSEMHSVSARFWNTVNPLRQKMILQINPPYLVVYAPTSSKGEMLSRQFEEYYQSMTSIEQQHVPPRQPRQTSRFRKFLLNSMYQGFSLLVRINIPSVLLTVVLIGIIMWLVPSLHAKWVQPFYEQLLGRLQRVISVLFRLMTRSFGDYDDDGVHRGAISAQEQFDHQQLEHNIKDVTIKTLSGRHVADIRRLAVNAKHGTVVSCGQDGRIIMWDADKGEWMARLDRVRQAHDEIMDADLNPGYWNMRGRWHNSKNPKGPTVGHQMVSARCVKVDQGNKWIASSFDDDIIRIWRISSGSLMREMSVKTPVLGSFEDEVSIVRQRHHRRSEEHQPSSTPHCDRRIIDRVIAIQFIGAVAEYCHPLVAVAAAKQRQTKGGSYDNTSQNYLISVHKSGIIREWDILSGECIQAFPSGHNRDITVLHVVECKAPHRNLGVTWIFTASKDGMIKCWERRLVKPAIDDPEASSNEAVTTWICIYTIEGHGGHAITALATEAPVGGMGVLVSGSSDGAVKVWNFETGDAVCTLSSGGFKRKNPEKHMGGPLLKFSKFSTDEDRHGGSSGAGNGSDSMNETSKTNSAAHQGLVTQVVVTRYCEVENGPGLCRGCDTCFGNGFGVASCALDETVHVWRLERADGNHEGSCTLCTKDYHQKRYTRSRPQASATADEPSDPKGQHRRAGTPNSGRRVYGAVAAPAAVKTVSTDESTTTHDLLDIEQLGGESNIVLEPKFLGKIRQLAGRGLVFCNNMVLAGVRKKSGASTINGNDWEAWFASLKYYINKEDTGTEIPVETFDLDPQDPHPQQTAADAFDTSSTETKMLGLIKHFIWGGDKTTDKDKKTEGTDSDDGDEYEEDYDEASELLPFSMIRHVVPLDGSGIGCDYGNFIKLIYLDDTCRKRHQLVQDAITATDAPKPSSMKSSCKCGNNGACGTNNTSKNKCCGGSNKNGSGCCSSTTAKRARRRDLGTSCQNRGDCSSNTNCPCSSASSSIRPSTVWKWQ